MTTTDPQPKPRKNIALWQQYLWYSEVLELRKAHLLRMDAIKRGKSDMSMEVEEFWMTETGLDDWKEALGKELATMGDTAGPIWTWITSIKGLKTGLFAAQLIAQIDDIGNFDTVSKLWRFSGYAVFDGKAEPKSTFKAPHDEKAGRHYNGKLKGILYNIGGSFLKSQTPHYSDIYYAEKKRQRELHPVAICRTCEIECNKKTNSKGHLVFRCPNNSKHVKNYSDQHLHLRAIRKMMNTFLKDLWLEWRRLEGLPIGEPWSGKQ